MMLKTCIYLHNKTVYLKKNILINTIKIFINRLIFSQDIEFITIFYHIYRKMA